MSRLLIVESGDHSPTPGTAGNVVAVNTRLRIPETLPISAVRIRRVFLPNIGWNVTSNNQELTLTIPADVAGPYVVNIAPGYYTGSTLLSAIVNAFSAAFISAASAFTIDIQFNSASFAVTISVFDGGSALTPFTLAAAVTIATETPSILQLLGFDDNPLVSVGGIEVSDGPLNAVSDRYALITCEEAKGMSAQIDSLSSPALSWHDGVVSMVPLTGGAGDIIEYLPEEDGQWIQLPKIHPESGWNGILTFYLSRSRYRYFGPNYVYWTMLLELR